MVSAQNVGGKPTLVRDDLTRMDARFFFPLAFDEPNPFLPDTFDQSDCNYVVVGSSRRLMEFPACEGPMVGGPPVQV